MEGKVKKSSLIISALEIVAIVVISIMASNMFIFTDALTVVLTFAVATGIPVAFFKRSRHYSMLGEVFLLLIAVTVVLMSEYDIWRATVHYGLPINTDSPGLESDDHRYFNWALAHYDGRIDEPHCTFIGFPLMIVGLWKIFGVGILWPLAMNCMATMSAVIICGYMTVEILHDRTRVKPSTIMAITLIICSGLFFLLSQTGRVQKEATSYLATALSGLALTRFYQRDSLDKKTVLIFAFGCVIMALVRTSFVYFFIIGAIVMSLNGWRRRWRGGLLLSAIGLLIFLGGCYLSFYTFHAQYVTIMGGNGMDKAFVIRGAQQPYLSLIGKYFFYPAVKRVLLLPLTMSVQYIIPFPWVYDRSPLVIEIFTRMRWMWYLVGGMALYYYFFIAWRRSEGLGIWALWPAIIFVVIAYVIGGSVSRYVLPFQILFIPQAIFVMLKLREGEYRKSFTIWAAAYLMILACTLVVCYNIQVSYLNDLDEFYRSMSQSAT